MTSLYVRRCSRFPAEIRLISAPLILDFDRQPYTQLYLCNRQDLLSVDHIYTQAKKLTRHVWTAETQGPGLAGQCGSNSDGSYRIYIHRCA